MKPTADAKSILAAMVVLLLGGAFSSLLFPTRLTAQGKAKDNRYEALVARVKSGDQSVDFRQLREAYAESSSSGKDTSEQKKVMTTALKDNRYADAIKSADAVLAADFVDMDAHFVASIAHREQKEYERADFHMTVFQKLVRSITDSGDGKTPETAYHVIEVHEEYLLLRVMGAGFPKSQSYLHKNGHAYDLLLFDDPETKKERSIYFNVDIPEKHGL